MIIFILSICILTLLTMALVPVVNTVNRHKNQVLSLFCEIEDSSVRRLADKCDRFIQKLQAEISGENGGGDGEAGGGANGDGGESGGDEMMMMGGVSGSQVDEDGDEYGIGGKNNGGNNSFKKRPRNITKTSKMFYLKFFIMIVAIEAYFSFQFASIRYFANVTKIKVQELNTTAYIDPFFWFTLNT
jgi:hypothetical protein